MALKDRDRQTSRRLMRLGIVRLGYRVIKCSNDRCDQRIRDTGENVVTCPNCGQKNVLRRNGKTVRYSYPMQADHFVLWDAPEIAQIYGEKPRELNVILPFREAHRNFDAFYELWAGGVLVCKGDGDQVLYAGPFNAEEDNKGQMRVHNAPGNTLVNDGQAQNTFSWNGKAFEPGEIVPCSGASQDLYDHCRACKAVARLKMLMADPELFRLGYYQLATGSGRNYDTLLATLELIEEAAGRVSGMPFVLRLVEEATSYKDESGTRRRTDKWFLQLEPEPDLTRKLYAKKIEQAVGEEKKALPPPKETESEDWVIEEKDSPPPYAEAEAEIEESKPEEAKFTPPDTWQEFAAAAIDRLGFNAQKHVINAWRKIKADPSAPVCKPDGTTAEKPEEMWALLAEHQTAKEAETE
jgi:predicted RNA-binding Zn-ribbon protein involved in translation (DUF1610 family)